MLSVLLDAASQIFLKLGANETLHGAVFGVSALRSPWVWLGIVCIIVSLVSWLHALRVVPLHMAYNIGGILHVLVPIGCWIFLGEHISLLRSLGIFLVLVGVYVVARPVIHVEERL